jgi:hypothetical protein
MSGAVDVDVVWGGDEERIGAGAGDAQEGEEEEVAVEVCWLIREPDGLLPLEPPFSPVADALIIADPLSPDLEDLLPGLSAFEVERVEEGENVVEVAAGEAEEEGAPGISPVCVETRFRVGRVLK